MEAVDREFSLSASVPLLDLAFVAIVVIDVEGELYDRKKGDRQLKVAGEGFFSLVSFRTIFWVLISGSWVALYRGRK